MNFQGLTKVENSDFYLDVAFRRAKERLEYARNKSFQGTWLEREKRYELIRLDIIRDSLCQNLRGIVEAFPVIDDLPIFYNELVRCTLDYDLLKQSLGAVIWAETKVNDFTRKYKALISKTHERTKVSVFRKQYYGRVCSVLKQVKKNFSYLEECRRVMRGFPSIKTDLFTVVIAGFPNVGKSTLLSKLSSARPEINDYSFTTRHLNLGYMKIQKKGIDQKIQLIDTPGALNRTNKMNPIELQAFLAMKHLANVFVYVYDFSEPYPMDMQEKLLKNIKVFKKKVIIYASKSDIISSPEFASFIRKKKAITSLDKLKERIIKLSFVPHPEEESSE